MADKKLLVCNLAKKKSQDKKEQSFQSREWVRGSGDSQRQCWTNRKMLRNRQEKKVKWAKALSTVLLVKSKKWTSHPKDEPCSLCTEIRSLNQTSNPIVGFSEPIVFPVMHHQWRRIPIWPCMWLGGPWLGAILMGDCRRPSSGNEVYNLH